MIYRDTLEDLIDEAEEALYAAQVHLGWLLERRERARIADLEEAARPDPSEDYQYIGEDY